MHCGYHRPSPSSACFWLSGLPFPIRCCSEGTWDCWSCDENRRTTKIGGKHKQNTAVHYLKQARRGSCVERRFSSEPQSHSYRSAEEQARHTWKSNQQQGGTFVLARRTGHWRLSTMNALVELSIKVAQEESFFPSDKRDTWRHNSRYHRWLSVTKRMSTLVCGASRFLDEHCECKWDIISQFSRNDQPIAP